MYTFVIKEKSDYLLFVNVIKAADGKQIKIYGNVFID